MRFNPVRIKSLVVVVLSPVLTLCAQQAPKEAKLDLTQQYLLLTTSRTSTMQLELDEAASACYRVLGGCRTGGGELALLLEKAAKPQES